jgi:hypothetical protein
MELVDSYYRSDRYKYSVDMIRAMSDDGKWAWSHVIPELHPEK